MTGRALAVHLSNTTSYPGGFFDVELEPRDNTRLSDARSIVVELICRHDCRRVEQPASRLSYARVEVELLTDQSSTHSVQLSIPNDAPISFRGELIRNQWSIDVSLDIPRARDPEIASTRVLVVPRNDTGRWAGPHPLR